MLPCPRPRHVACVSVGGLLECLLSVWVVEQRVDGLRQAGGISERNEDSTAVGQRFLSVQVGGGDDRLAGPERICQGDAGYLLRIEVWRDVNVARKQQFDDVSLRHVFI